jgi:very-short-patch-repair endonuclease
VNSALYHEALTDQAADDTRRAELEGSGYRVETFTDSEIWFNPAGTVSRLRTIARTTRNRHRVLVP